METVYIRFESYDFTGNKEFQNGLVTLEDPNILTNASKLLDMKLFFYNRFVEPINSTWYRQWHFGPSHRTLVDSSVAQLEQLALSASASSGGSQNNTEKASTDTGTPQLSFEEVIRLVQSGKDVPGVTKLDIKPNNQHPTPSKMERILKPWEIPMSKLYPFNSMKN